MAASADPAVTDEGKPTVARTIPFGNGRRTIVGDSYNNGRDLSGWEHVGKGRVYVEGGLLKTERGMGLLWYTRQKLGDCTLRVVFKEISVVDERAP